MINTSEMFTWFIIIAMADMLTGLIITIFFRWLDNRKKKKFEDITCEKCGKSRKVYLCLDKITWLCYICKKLYNQEYRVKQKELKLPKKEGEA